MRLQESTAYPPSSNNQYPPAQPYDITVAGGANYSASGGFGSYVSTTPPFITPSSIFFPVPRLGRVWNVDRFTINPTQAYALVNNTLATSTIIVNCRIFLNNVAVSDRFTLAYNILVGPSFPTPMVDQQGPVTVTPFNDLQVRPSDQLRCEVFPTVTNSPPGAGQTVAMRLVTAMSVLGTNERG